MTFQDYESAIQKHGNITNASKALNIPKETFRQRYAKAKSEWETREKTIVVIPDAHALPGHDNDRFEWAGKLCADVACDIVVDIGDQADMESLCSYDRGTKSFEGRRYKKDIAVAVDARERFDIGLGNHKPMKEFLEGNHEHRISKVVELQAEFDGVISLEDLKHAEFGWNVTPYGIPKIIDNIAFCHSFPSGVMNRPIGGENHAASLIKKNFMSSVCGHSHLADYAERTRIDGSRLCGLVVGCFFEFENKFAGPTVNKMYRRGIWVLRNVKNGEFNVEFISLEELKKRYK